MSVMAAYYLSRKLGGALWHGQEPRPSGRVIVLLPWLLPELDQPIDLAINTCSFQHMDARNLRFYFAHLRRLGVGMIFSLNREKPSKRGEVAYLPFAADAGYEIELRESLAPWHSGISAVLLRRHGA